MDELKVGHVYMFTESRAISPPWRGVTFKVLGRRPRSYNIVGMDRRQAGLRAPLRDELLAHVVPVYRPVPKFQSVAEANAWMEEELEDEHNGR